MILWHQLVQQDVELLLSRGVNVDKDEIYRSMQNIMDCLYDVPSSPYFVEPLMHPPMLGGQSELPLKCPSVRGQDILQGRGRNYSRLRIRLEKRRKRVKKETQP